MGYRDSAINGLKWVGSYRFLLRVFSIVRTAILARLLTPAQFGVFGVAAIVLGLLEMFTETGINVFLVQQDQKNALKTYLNTAWVISILRGAIIALIIIISSPLVIRFFRSPASLPILLIMALIPLVRGFINPSVASFQKNLAFKDEFWYRSLIMLSDAAAAITTAFITKSAISLAYGLLFSAVLEAVLSFIIFKLRPCFRFDKIKAKTIISQGKWITSAGVFSYFSQKTPDIVIGRTLPSTSLGFFQMAYRLSIMPFDEALEMFNRVAFPVYTKIAGDRVRLIRAMKQYYFALLAICLPILIFMLLFATPIVKIILGNNWLPIVPTLRILSIAGIVLVLNGAIDPLLLATKNQRYLSHVNLVRVISVVCLAIPFTYWGGIEGAALALFISLLITLPVRFYYGFRAFAAIPPISDS